MLKSPNQLSDYERMQYGTYRNYEREVRRQEDIIVDRVNREAVNTAEREDRFQYERDHPEEMAAIRARTQETRKQFYKEIDDSGAPECVCGMSSIGCTSGGTYGLVTTGCKTTPFLWGGCSLVTLLAGICCGIMSCCVCCLKKGSKPPSHSIDIGRLETTITDQPRGLL
jgi:hypothetical protein